MASSLGDLDSRVAAETAQAADAGVAEIRKGGDKAEGAFSQLGDRLTAASAAIGAAAGATLATGLADALDLDRAQAILTAKLGDEALAEQLGEVAGEVYARGFGDSISQVMEDIQAVAAVDLVPSGDVETLEALTVAAEAYAAMWGTDVADSVMYAQGLITSGLAVDATHAMDLIVAASDAAGTALRSDVLEAVNEYGKDFAVLGFTGEQAFSMIATAAASGTIALDKAADALKELNIRATDISDTAVTGTYEELGLDATAMANAILAGGDSAEAATQTIVQALLGVKDPATQASMAIALFGTPLEDLGKQNIPDFLTSLASAENGLGDVSGAATEAATTLEESSSQKLTAFGNTIKLALSDKLAEALPYIEKLIDFVSRNSDLFTGIGLGLVGFAAAVGTARAGIAVYNGTVLVAKAGMAAWRGVVTACKAAQAAHTAVVNSAAIAQARSTVATVASTAATKAAAAGQWLLNAAMSANPITLIIIGIIALIAIFVLLWTKCDWFRNFWIGLWEGIKSAASAVGDWFSGPFLDFFRNAWDWLTDKWNAFIDFVAGLPGRVSSAASGMWDGFKSSFRSAVNWIIGKWNGLSFTIGGGSFMGMGIPRTTLGTPDIPYLASGGTITAAGAAVVGESGPELLNLPTGAQVTPLDGSLGREIASAVTSALAPVLANSQAGQQGDIVLTLDGEVISRVALKTIRRNPTTVARSAASGNKTLAYTG